MRIVTLNTWKNEGEYSRRLDLMASGLAALDPDLVCLQECFVGAGRDTGLFLAKALGLSLHAAPARAKLRPHGGQLVESSSGLSILSRGPGEAAAILELASHPADGQRIAQRLDIAPGGRPLRVLNTHLTHLRGASDLRGQQMRSALAWACEGLAGALVVAGDLNAPATAPELAGLNAQDAFDQPTLLGAGLHAPAPPRPPIDHLVLQQAGAWRATGRARALDQADPEGWYPSDHAAVVLDLA